MASSYCKENMNSRQISPSCFIIYYPLCICKHINKFTHSNKLLHLLYSRKCCQETSCQAKLHLKSRRCTIIFKYFPWIVITPIPTTTQNPCDSPKRLCAVAPTSNRAGQVRFSTRVIDLTLQQPMFTTCKRERGGRGEILSIKLTPSQFLPTVKATFVGCMATVSGLCSTGLGLF